MEADLTELADAVLGHTLGIALTPQCSEQTGDGDVLAYIALHKICSWGAS